MPILVFKLIKLCHIFGHHVILAATSKGRKVAIRHKIKHENIYSLQHNLTNGHKCRYFSNSILGSEPAEDLGEN